MAAPRLPARTPGTDAHDRSAARVGVLTRSVGPPSSIEGGFSSLGETLCSAGVGGKVRDYYSKFIIDSDNIKTVFNLSAGHTFVRSNTSTVE